LAFFFTIDTTKYAKAAKPVA